MNLLRINPWRRGNRKWALLALIIAASPFFAWLYFRLGRVEHPDYQAEAAALVESRLPPEARDPSLSNGWEAVEEMFQAFRAANRALGGSDGDGRPGSRAVILNFDEHLSPVDDLDETAATATPKESFLALEEAGFFRAAERLTAYTRVVPPLSDDLGEDPFQDTNMSVMLHSDLRWAVIALTAEMRRAAVDGDAERIAARVDQIFVLGRATGLRIGMFSWLAGNGAFLSVYSAVPELLLDSALEPAVMRGLLEAIAQPPELADADLLIETIRLGSSSRLRWGYGLITSSPIQSFNPIGPLLIANERAAMRALHSVIDAASAFASVPFCARDHSVISPDAVMHALGHRYGSVELALYPPESSLTVIEMTRMRWGGARLHLAIELYRCEHGEPPLSLEDLVPAYLAELPTDPLAPDGRFRYLLLKPGGDPHGRSYLLYSVGLDCTDNAGTVESRRGFRAMDQRDVGHDFVINELPGWRQTEADSDTAEP